jgi:hypothetical protein
MIQDDAKIVYKLCEPAKPVKKYDMYTAMTPMTPKIASLQLTNLKKHLQYPLRSS